MHDIRRKARDIRLLILDVDGVLTDGRLYFGNQGEELKAFHIRDGHGIKMLMNQGVEVAVISGRHAAATERRLSELGVRHLCLGVEDKRGAFTGLLGALGLEPAQAAYVGDDIIDLPVMRRVGLAVAVADAHYMVKGHAHWETSNPGGRGAVREVCELLLEAQDTLEAELSRYL